MSANRGRRKFRLANWAEALLIGAALSATAAAVAGTTITGAVEDGVHPIRTWAAP